MSTLGIDIRCLQDRPYAGISSYTYELVRRSANVPDLKLRLFSNSLSRTVPQFGPNACHVHIPVPSKILTAALATAHFPHLDAITGSDTFWMPNMHFWGFSKRARVILTVHDLSFERFPDLFSKTRRAWHAALRPRALCERADRIIAVSQHTKRDLMELYGIPDEKITVIYSGIDASCVPLEKTSGQYVTAQRELSLPDEYILYLGTIEPRKNIETVIEAFTAVKKSGKFPNLHLVIAGARGWNADHVYALAHTSPYSAQIKFSNHISAEHKAAVYAGATVFVFPSFYEGFGHPPLEAQACGVPVIAGANSSLLETLGDSALLVTPDFVNETASALTALLSDRQLREEYRKRGLANAARFSWDRCAEQTLNVVQK